MRDKTGLRPDKLRPNQVAASQPKRSLLNNVLKISLLSPQNNIQSIDIPVPVSYEFDRSIKQYSIIFNDDTSLQATSNELPSHFMTFNY